MVNFVDSVQTAAADRIYRYKRRGVEEQSCATRIENDGLSLINEGINQLSPNITVQNRFYKAIEDLYNIMKVNKASIKDKVGRSLQTYFPKINQTLFSLPDFEKSFIYAYSSNVGYYDLNKALREHACTTKLLTAQDKSLAPYGAALTAILMHWEYLPSTNKTTYRGSVITQTELDTYNTSRSSSIVWLNFASSSTDQSVSGGFSGNVTFTIKNTNSELSKWRPKLICNCSKFPYECEALYPPGAVFDVNRVAYDGRRYTIDLTLRGDGPAVGRKRRSVSPDVSTQNGVCYKGSTSSSWICRMNVLNLIVMTIIGKLGSFEFE